MRGRGLLLVSANHFELCLQIRCLALLGRADCTKSVPRPLPLTRFRPGVAERGLQVYISWVDRPCDNVCPFVRKGCILWPANRPLPSTQSFSSQRFKSREGLSGWMSEFETWKRLIQGHWLLAPRQNCGPL